MPTTFFLCFSQNSYGMAVTWIDASDAELAKAANYVEKNDVGVDLD
jgi:hypothetical protein